MKKILLGFAAISISSIHSFGQITLGKSDFPSSGKIYNLSTALPFIGMDATATGANYSWDFTQFSSTRIGARVDTFLSVAQTAQLYALYFSIFGPHPSNQAVSGVDFKLGTFLNVANAFNFFNNKSSGYNQTGFGANVQFGTSPPVPMPIGYSPEDVVYKYPVSFGNIDSCAPAYAISIPNVIYYGVNMTRKNEVDGWGILKTPYGTFNALRLKSTIIEIDTFYIDTIVHYGMTLPPITRTEYKWLGTGMGEPLLQINMTGTAITSIAYLDSVRFSGITTPEISVIDMNIYPNPASDHLVIQYSLSASSDLKIEVVDLLGNTITSSEMKNQFAGNHLSILELPESLPASANYFVRMIWDGNRQLVKSLVVVK